MKSLTDESELDKDLAALNRRKRKLLEILSLRREVVGLEMLAMPGLASDDAEAMTIIIEEVCAQYRVTFANLLSRERTEAMSRPRQIVFYLGRLLKEIPYVQLGRMFKRNHGTILHGVRNVGGCIETDGELWVTVERIRERCRQRLGARQ